MSKADAFGQSMQLKRWTKALVVSIDFLRIWTCHAVKCCSSELSDSDRTLFVSRNACSGISIVCVVCCTALLHASQCPIVLSPCRLERHTRLRSLRCEIEVRSLIILDLSSVSNHG